jgi:sugar/nucleoside kinase (ribokinase family)
MPDARKDICQSAADKLEAARPDLASVRCLIGFDGFVDEIIGVVDKWLSPAKPALVPTISALAAKIARAARKSANYELFVKQEKLGGNGPIMANALAAVGMRVSYIGTLGKEKPHKVFAVLVANAEDVVTIADAGHTDALEFSDGKLMLGKLASLKDFTWDNLLARLPIDQLKAMVARSSLVGMANWTMLPFMSDIWAHLLADVLPGMDLAGKRFFVDLADPEKRTPRDIRAAMRLLGEFQKQVDLTLGLNLKEAGEIADVLGIAHRIDGDKPFARIAESLVTLSSDIRRKLKIECVVIHPRHGAAGATASESAAFAGPFVQSPRISTGAGDHFNAGLCTGRVLGMSLAQSLCVGVATSGLYVRSESGRSPSASDLVKFIRKLPPPQEDR